MSHKPLPCQRRIVETRRDPHRGTHYLHLLDCGHIVARQASLTRRQAQCGHCMALLTEEEDRRAIWDRWRPEPVKLKVVGESSRPPAAEGGARANVRPAASMPPGLVAVGDVA